MQSPAYFAPIRQIWSKATCRVSGQTTFHQFFGGLIKKAIDLRGQDLEISGNP
jgi:hypothetical protein